MKRPASNAKIWWCSFCKALFLDVPYVVDSIVRHADYDLNRLHDYAIGPNGGALPVRRRFLATPDFTLFALVLVFAAYGPTLSAVCSALGSTMVGVLHTAFGLGCVAAAFVLYLWSLGFVARRVERRLDKQNVRLKRPLRRRTARAALYVLALGCIAPLGFFGASLLERQAFDACRPEVTVSSIAVLVLVVMAVLWMAMAGQRIRSTAGRTLAQAVLLVALTVIIWTLPGSESATEASQLPYRNVFAAIAIGMAATAFASTLLLRTWSWSEKEAREFRDALHRRELFSASREDPKLSTRRVLGGAITGILQRPLQVLLLPAFFVILVPVNWMWRSFALGVIASLSLVIAAHLTSRWDRLTEYLRRYFLLGTPLVISLFVIVIASLRLADVQYVATILNVAPFGTLFVWMVMTYVLSWWFELHVNGVLATQLLRAFAGNATSDTVVVPYVPAPGFVPGKVELAGRYLLAHPLGQFVVVGWFRDRDGAVTRAFTTFGGIELFDKLVEGTGKDTAREVNRRVQLYFGVVNLVLIALAWLFFWHFGRADSKNTVAPVVTAQQGAGTENLALLPLLVAKEGDTAPAIVVAGSGGGTRAALYTASVLRGLHDLEVDKDIVLVSGVSGGAVAVAYFAGHRDGLVAGVAAPCSGVEPATSDPWQCFVERMAQPFIRDVLEGAGEWRIQSEQPLGVLLAESLQRRVFADGKPTIGSGLGVGMILNTTITGHPVEDSPMLDGALAFAPPRAGSNCANAERPVAALGGGRLAFSNLDVGEAAGFRAASNDARNLQLPFVIVRDDAVELAKASALSANFPPVFPNARVNLGGYAPNARGCTVRTYYVTDGGATENLGLVSALLALENALTNAKGKMRLRDIRIVMAEGSAVDYDYEQDRGVGAATGQSKERLTGRLTLELLRRVQEAVKAVDPNATVTLHDLSLPRVFRSRGGLGTNWMFPRDVQVTTPLTAMLPSKWRQWLSEMLFGARYSVTLDKQQLLAVWQALFSREGDFCAKQWTDDPSTTVAGWICGREEQGTAKLSPDAMLASWQRFRDVMKK